MNISPNFTLASLTFSETALRKGLANDPTPEHLANLRILCVLALEPVVELLGNVKINSAYRSQKVNAAVGGSTTSAHMTGLAADIVPLSMDLKSAYAAIRASSIPFDQLILECNAWIHIGLAPTGVEARGDLLVASGSPGAWKYTRFNG